MNRAVIFRSNHIAPDPRVEKIALALSKSYTVHVVGWDRTGTLPRKQTRPTFSLELFSFFSPFGSGKKNLFRLLRWQAFLFLWVLRNGRSYEAIHACDFDTVYPALFGKWLFGCKVVYDIFDFYADHIRNTPDWLRRMIRRLDYWAIRKANALILVAEAQLTQLDGVRPARLVFIYNTPVDTPQPAPPPRDPAVGLRIAYIGLLQVERSLMEMLDLVQKHPTWHFDLAGFGGDEPEIVRRASQIPNVTWHGRIPYEETLTLSGAADVLFSICDPTIYHYSSPNKVFEAMMLSKPIVVARDTNMDQIVEEHACGLVIHYGNLAEIEDAFEALEQNPDLRLKLGNNGRCAYDEFFNWERMEKRLLDLYQEL